MKVANSHRTSILYGYIGLGLHAAFGRYNFQRLHSTCLISHNPAYKPIKLGSSDSVYCCGRVLGVVEE